MKKFISLFLLLSILTSGITVSAQSKKIQDSTARAQKKAERKAAKEKAKADKAAKAADATTATTPAEPATTKKSRSKKAPKDVVNPSTTATTPAAPATTTPATTKSKVPAQAANTSADKVVGTDDKGRTIYEGPRGGRYYLTRNGNKEYIKKKQ